MSEQVPQHQADPASFRDPDSSIIWVEGRVWRYFDAGAAAGFKALIDSGVLDRMVKEGRVIPYSELGKVELDRVKSIVPHADYAIEHPVIPFVSYGYEWSFNMLKDAALLLLDVLAGLLEAGFVLKDGSSHNVQFINGRPTFIDLGSIEAYTEGRVWAGYTQFCQTFLNPLLLQAATRVPFQPWLRGSPVGIEPEVLYRLLSGTARFRRGAFFHVTLQTWLNKLFASDSGTSLPGTKKNLINRRSLIRQANSLRKTIGRLKIRLPRSLWVDYDPSGSYPDKARQAKMDFIQTQLARLGPKVIYDCGCNTGEYSFCAAGYAHLVVAMDFDPEAVDALYRHSRGKYPNVLPLVMDMTNPSPNQGWAQTEHRGLQQRGTADLVLWLALTHHLALSFSIPLEQQVAWMASLSPRAIIEFVPASDPRAGTLVKWRPDATSYRRYNQETLEKALRQHFTRIKPIALPNSERVLYLASR